MTPLPARVMAGALMSVWLFAAAAAGATEKAVSTPTAAEKADQAQAVSIRGMKFEPASLTVSTGTTVVWTNFDDEPHTVASANGAFRSSALDQDDRFTFRFDKPGTYPYICTIHPMMSGTIVVK